MSIGVSTGRLVVSCCAAVSEERLYENQEIRIGHVVGEGEEGGLSERSGHLSRRVPFQASVVLCSGSLNF